jgi:hypothetical protein
MPIDFSRVFRVFFFVFSSDDSFHLLISDSLITLLNGSAQRSQVNLFPERIDAQFVSKFKFELDLH